MALAAVDTYTAISPRQAVESFLQAKEAIGLSRNTLRYYQYHLRVLASYLESVNIEDVGALTVHHMRGFLQARRNAGVSPANMSACGRSLKVFLNWAIQEELIREDVSRKLRVPMQPRCFIQPFTDNDVRNMVKAAAEGVFPVRDVAMLLLLFDTGMRASELCNLTDEDIRADRVVIRVAKRNKQRIAPIGPLTLEAVRLWQKVRGPSGSLFTRPLSGKAMTYKDLERMFKRVGKRADVQGVRCTPHTARHTAATNWLRSGGDVSTLQQLLGHSLIATTMRYVHLADDDLINAHHHLGLVGRLAGEQ